MKRHKLQDLNIVLRRINMRVEDVIAIASSKLGERDARGYYAELAHKHEQQ